MKVSELNDGDELTYLSEPDGSVLECLEKGKTYKVETFNGSKIIRCNGIHDKYGHSNEHFLLDSSMINFDRFIQASGGWIGVDLDCTLAVYDGWKGPYHIGEPIPAMVERVKAWLAAGREVRIFTARVTERVTNRDGTPHDIVKVRQVIDEFCMAQFNRTLPITNIKTWDMMELWDDRCVQVRPNTGVSLADELEAIRNAEAPHKYPEK